MNTIISASKAQTMTSKQIAVVVEKRPDYNGDEDGFWGFVILLLAVVASFGLGCAVGGAV